MTKRVTMLGVVLVTGLVTSCASAPKAGWYQPPSELDASRVPPCAFEAPYLPDPCRLEITPGEWLVVRNPKVEPASKPRWWWALLVLAL